MISSHNKLELWYPLNDTVKLYSRFSPNMQSKKKKKTMTSQKLSITQPKRVERDK